MLPALMPDHLLVHDGTSLGHHTAKNKDDLRVAKDWKSYYKCYFERERYTIPRPAETHRAPDYATLHEKLAAVFNNTKETVKTTVAEHLQEVITKAEQRLTNPPQGMPSSISLKDITSLVLENNKETMSAAVENMAKLYTKSMADFRNILMEFKEKK